MQLMEASILIVDDEPALLEIMDEWFQSVARRVHCAADGWQALEILANNKIDLILTDIRMPGMNGTTLLEKIKVSRLPLPRVIFITGFADATLRDVYDLGAEALIEKPTDHDDLIRTLEKSLLEPGERWRQPLDLSACPVLRRTFASLSEALGQHRIAFGRGGFSIEGGRFLTEGPVTIELNFKADGYVLSGQGMVRWLVPEEDQIGIELTYVAEASLPRLLEITAMAQSFIPRSTGRTYHARAG